MGCVASNEAIEDKRDTINDLLPDEMLAEIFEYLSLHELIVNTSKTCCLWREIIARYMLQPKLITLANTHGKFKEQIQALNWTEDCQDPQLIRFFFL